MMAPWFRLFVPMLAFWAVSAAARGEALGEPAFSPVTYQRTVWAYEGYRAQYEKGGWPDLPASVAGLMEGDEGPAVVALKQRLILMRDMAPEAADDDRFDQRTREGVRHFQRRHGLSASGKIGERTLRALSVTLPPDCPRS